MEYSTKKNPANNKWYAQVKKDNGNTIQVGCYNTETEASNALDKVILMLIKEMYND